MNRQNVLSRLGRLMTNWYDAMMKEAAGAPFSNVYSGLFKGQRGEWFAVGNAFNIKDNLRIMGFQWDGPNYKWVIAVQRITPDMKARLDGMGVPTTALAPQQPAAPVARPAAGGPTAPGQAPAAQQPAQNGPRLAFLVTKTGRIMPKGNVDPSIYTQYLRPLGFGSWNPPAGGTVHLIGKDKFIAAVQNPDNATLLQGLKRAGYDAYAFAKAELGVDVADPSANQPQQPQEQPQQNGQQPMQQADQYFLAMRMADRKVVVAKKSAGMDGMAAMVSYVDLGGEQGMAPETAFGSEFQTLKDKQGQPLTSFDMDELKRWGEGFQQSDEQLAQGRAKHVLPDSKLNDEGKAIDARFGKMMEDAMNGSVSHMMINALAGSGKTTMLKHLAWKFGKPGERWLYLVFNKKNQVEGKEKFPNWVTVKTTNAFLGDVLDKHNVGNPDVGSTRRMKTIENANGKRGGNGDDDAQVPDKIRYLADTRNFSTIMQSVGIHEMTSQEVQYINNAYQMGNGQLGVRVANFIERTIEYTFKDESIKLAELCKAYAIDPRDPAFEAKMNEVASKYDIGFGMPDAKEHINKWKGQYRQEFLMALAQILKYDFMHKSYEKEMKVAAKWLLEQSLPGGTDEKYRHSDGKSYDLGQHRDFSDDLWLTAIAADKMAWPHYDYVLADEVQDFNQCQSIMLQKLAQAGAKIVAVGDPNQSIYRFRGADAESFGRVANMLEGISADKNVVQSLSRNFRSRKAVLDYVNQNTHVKNLAQGKQFEDGQEGMVSNGQFDEHGMMNTIAQDWQSGQMPETAILSRTNEPLAEAALQLLGHGVPFVIVGKDVARDLTNHVKKIMRMSGATRGAKGKSSKEALEKAMQNTFVGDFVNSMLDHTEKENDRFGRSAAKKGYLQELNDRTTAVNACAEQFNNDQRFPNKTVAEFTKWVSMKLKGLNIEDSEKDLAEYQAQMESKRPPVVLTTAHRSKGLEFSRVFVMRPELFPHPKSVREEDLAQEANAKYVAYTRAMDNLHILKPKPKPGEEEA